MSRLEKRVERLEHGLGGQTAVWALVPASWPGVNREIAAQRLAEENGAEPPFEFALLPGKGDEARLLYVGPPLDPVELWRSIAEAERQ